MSPVSNLKIMRETVGAESVKGRLLSNLIEQTPWLDDPDPRPWAIHPTHNIRWLMNVQVETLAKSA